MARRNDEDRKAARAMREARTSAPGIAPEDQDATPLAELAPGGFWDGLLGLEALYEPWAGLETQFQDYTRYAPVLQREGESLEAFMLPMIRQIARAYLTEKGMLAEVSRRARAEGGNLGPAVALKSARLRKLRPTIERHVAPLMEAALRQAGGANAV